MSLARDLVSSMRPRQWTKNLIVFTPLIFVGDLFEGRAVLAATSAFVIFCAISSAVYLANDVNDREYDRAHELKRHRPIAAGKIRPTSAIGVALALAVSALAGAFAISVQFGLWTSAYVALQAIYTLWLKHQVILDVMAIAAGFVLRVWAGAVVIGVGGSPWLFLCAALLALFLGFAKRRHELTLLESDAAAHRPALEHYSAPLIDAMLASVTAATIIAYALYTFFSTTAQAAPYLMLTVPFVTYGLFRYLYLIHQRNLGGAPEEVLLTDTPLIIDIVLWLIAVAIALYLT